MKKINFLVIVILFLFMGCALQGTQPVTPVDRSLVYFNQYMSLEETYKNHYLASTPEEQAELSQNVAPILDRMRVLLIAYSKVATSGTDAVDTRLEIMQLGREAALKLTRSISQ